MADDCYYVCDMRLFANHDELDQQNINELILGCTKRLSYGKNTATDRPMKAIVFG